METHQQVLQQEIKEKKRLEKIIRQGRDDGYFRPDIKINTMKIAIFGALDELAREWILGENHHLELKEYASELANTFIRGLAPISGGVTI